MNKTNDKLNVQAIFDSIDGEVNAFDGAGQLATFIRLKECNLRCGYCDTKYAQESQPENEMFIDEVIQQVHFKKVTITGGEPMLQRSALAPLLSKLYYTNHEITIETNGSISVFFLKYGYEYNWILSKEPDRIRYVVDYKLPSSGMESKMNLGVFRDLRFIDVIKFVISDEKDYQRACEIIKKNPTWIAKKVFSSVTKIEYDLLSKVGVDNFPIVTTDWPRQLAEMMIRDRVDAQFSLQLHKILWPGAKEER